MSLGVGALGGPRLTLCFWSVLIPQRLPVFVNPARRPVRYRLTSKTLLRGQTQTLCQIPNHTEELPFFAATGIFLLSQKKMYNTFLPIASTYSHPWLSTIKLPNHNKNKSKTYQNLNHKITLRPPGLWHKNNFGWRPTTNYAAFLHFYCWWFFWLSPALFFFSVGQKKWCHVV